MDFEQVLGLDHEHEVDGMTPEELEKADWWCKTCTKRGSKDPHVMRPWDILNETMHGNHRSWVQEFRLTKDKDNRIFIGNTEITEPRAIKIANKYV